MGHAACNSICATEPKAWTPQRVGQPFEEFLKSAQRCHSRPFSSSALQLFRIQALSGGLPPKGETRRLPHSPCKRAPQTRGCIASHPRHPLEIYATNASGSGYHQTLGRSSSPATAPRMQRYLGKELDNEGVTCRNQMFKPSHQLELLSRSILTLVVD